MVYEKLVYLMCYAHAPAGEVPEQVSPVSQAAPVPPPAVVPHMHVLELQVFDVPEQAVAVPHKQVPEVQVSEVVEQADVAVPQTHVLEVQVSEEPEQAVAVPQ